MTDKHPMADPMADPMAGAPERTVTTRDIGIALRDLMEERDIVISSDADDGESVQTELRTTVEFIDVSDPDNPVIHLSTGQAFRCAIVAIGP
jgi:hypothetical protein